MSLSLSDNPQPKITARTAKDICSDIWAGAIEYARETGYKLDPMVTTTIWSGLLMSVNKDLEEYGLLDAVQQQFVPSFSYIYDIGFDKVELLADIKNKQAKIWEIMSQEIDELNGKLEVLFFIMLLDSVNAQFLTKEDSAQIIKPAEECVRLFQVQSQLLSAHIYGLVHDFDNGIIRQFAPVPIATNPAVATGRNDSAKRSAEVESSYKQEEASKNGFHSFSILGFVALAMVLIAIVVALARVNPAWLAGFLETFCGIMVEVGTIIFFASVFFTKNHTLGVALRLSGGYLFLIGVVLFCIAKLYLI